MYQTTVEEQVEQALCEMPIWHITEAANRASITAQGLIPSEHGHDAEQPIGVYAWRTAWAKEAWAQFNLNYATPGMRYDVWRINMDKITCGIVDDTAWNGEAVVALGPIPPHAIRRVLTYVAD